MSGKGGRKQGQRVGRYGAGSVTKLGKGHFKIRVRVDGKQLQRRVHCANEYEAWALLRELRKLPDQLQVAKEMGDPNGWRDPLMDWLDKQAADDRTFGDAADKYLTELEVSGKAPSYVRSVRLSLDAHVLPVLGEIALRQLKVGDLTDLRDSLAQQLSATTVRKVGQCIRGVFNLGEARGWIENNPAKRVKLPPVRSPNEVQRKYRTPTRQEMERILLAASDYGSGYMVAAIAIALASGARAGEVCGLRWQDVDLKNRLVQIERAVDSVTGKLRDTKSHRHRESLLMDVTALTEWQTECGETKPDWFILTNTDTPMHPHNVAHAWRKICERAEVKGVRFHDLRGEFITRLTIAGIDIRTVAALAGHQDSAMTLRRYARPMSAKEVAAIVKRASQELTAG